jgi:arylsulfatase A-like enzyme
LIEKTAAAPSGPSPAGSPAGLVTSGLAAGLLAGALLGLCEAVVILVSANEGADRQVLWYGTLLYAALTGAAGAAAGLAASLLGTRRPRPDLFSAIFLPASLAVGGLLLGRFRIARDVLAEHPMSAAQQLTLIGWAILFFLCLALPLYSLAGRRHPYAILRPGIHAILAGVVLLCAIFFATAMAPGAPRVPPAPRAVPPALADRPNVILIMVDTLRADRLPAYGYHGIATPAIDALAADGAVYTHAIAQASWTKPSAASLLTGLYPSTHQAYRKADLLPDAVTTLPEAMRKAGFRTGGIVTNINLAPSFQFDQGYDEYLYLAPDYFFGASESSSKLAAYSGLRLVRERFLSRRKDVRHYYQDAATTTRVARAWLDRNGQSRFFLFLHYMDPHDPYFVHPYDGRAVARVDTPRPDPSRARELSDLYDGEVAFLDQHLGAFIQDLKRRRLYDRTLIVLTSDHGEEFHEHGGWWHGTTLYDEQIRVPLIVKPPASAAGAPRGSVGGIARSIDVAPTVLAFCGLAKGDAMQGISLLAAQPGDEAFSEEDFEGNRLRALRSTRWKLIEASPGNRRGLLEQELYAVDVDPDERRNLARRDTGRARAMRARLDHALGAALKAAVAAKQGRIDADTRQRLKALGYVQ